MMTALLATGLFAATSCSSNRPMKKKTSSKAMKAKEASGGKKKVDLSQPFSHENHLALLRVAGDRPLGCNDCHALDGAVADTKNPICETTRMPFPTHGKCNGCHEAAFRTLPLQICTNCHTQNTISEKPPMRPQGDKVVLHVEYSHKLHLDPNQRVAKRFKIAADCQTCHAFEDGGEKVNTPNHANCCECHTAEHVEPNINDCDGCHKSNKPQERTSSLKFFSHADHTTDPLTGQTLDCMRCHSAVAEATNLTEVTTPVMSTCTTCHKGEVAFDYVKCLKCHEAGIEKRPLPEDHPK